MGSGLLQPRPRTDRDGKTAEERFAAIHEMFFAWVSDSGMARKEFYNRPKLGDAREPTEEEVVRRWAGDFNVRLNDVLMGIERAFAGARDRGEVVTSFRYCIPKIVARIAEMRGARVGSQ